VAGGSTIEIALQAGDYRRLGERRLQVAVASSASATIWMTGRWKRRRARSTIPWASQFERRSGWV
jgi:hypothetical protein